MKVSLVLWLTLVSSATISHEDSLDSTITAAPDPGLVKRIDADYVEQQLKALEDAEAKAYGAAGSTTDTPKPWRRTIYGSIVEIVRPTVIQGVTLSAKPPIQTNGLEPWISLKKDGSPLTVKPQLKNGHTNKPSPTYGTWFATPTTVRFTGEQLKAHNMAPDEIHEEVEWIEEDQTYHSLNPIIRCTPDSYFKKGINKNVLSEPFCFPRDNSVLKLGRSYFITWFSKYFEGAEKVRFHLSAVKVGYKDVGFKKRSAIMDNGGAIQQKSFWSSAWIDNESGMFPMEIIEDFLVSKDQMERVVLLSIQPDTVDLDEFDYLQNSLILKFIRPGKVYKDHNQDLHLLEQKQKLSHLQVEYEEGLDYAFWFTILGIPTAVIFIAFGMYIFVWINKVDLSNLKPKKARGRDHNHRRIPFVSKKQGYSLPQHNSDIPLDSLKND